MCVYIYIYIYEIYIHVYMHDVNVIYIANKRKKSIKMLY